MEKVKAFLDSNVLFSIAYSGKETSRSYVLYELQRQGHVNLNISNLVREEVLFNLQEKRKEALELAKELLETTVVLPDISLDLAAAGVSRLPENDRLILGTAVFHEMDYFLTGNIRDFKRYYRNRIFRTMILSPRDFLNRKF
jgi:predicted nucleic acid-binding protein